MYIESQNVTNENENDFTRVLNTRIWFNIITTKIH